MGVPVTLGALVAGKYRLEREIGSGGMGVVFAATHVHLDQQVALKFLLSEAVSPETLERFWREARAVVKIQSEYVARVIDIGDLDGATPYIVMEYLDGRDLETIVKDEGPLPIEDAIRFVLQACEAFAEVHAQGIVHRDIKPANLFMTARADGSQIVKVLDFGISKPAWEEKDGRLTHTSAVIGSPRYMSPEQLRSSRDVDVRSDVWAIGVTLFEIIGGASPFATGTMPEVCASILKDPPLPLTALRPEVPTRLDLVVRRCLEKNPADRYNDVGELANALRPFGPVDSSTVSAQRIANVLLQVRPPTIPPGGFPSRTTAPRAAQLSPTEYPGMALPRTDTEKGAFVPPPSFEETLDDEIEDEEPTTPPRASSQIAIPRVQTDPVARSDKELEAHYLGVLGPVGTVPHRTMDLARMTSLSIDHRAGFLMSHMDGSTTLEELLDMSGMSRVETLKLVCELLEHRLIRLS